MCSNHHVTLLHRGIGRASLHPGRNLLLIVALNVRLGINTGINAGSVPMIQMHRLAVPMLFIRVIGCVICLHVLLVQRLFVPVRGGCVMLFFAACLLSLHLRLGCHQMGLFLVSRRLSVHVRLACCCVMYFRVTSRLLVHIRAVNISLIRHR
ncbi:MAG: hypothetical protein ACHQTF_11380, partial [Gemmatimonadales bacterium]